MQASSGEQHGGTRRARAAADLLRIEAQALVEAANRFDGESFDAAVGLVLSATGKVITVGAGASGIIARKLAATLTSTGTPAMFLHPSDALHGGLGMVSSGDVVVAVSNSGETAEVLGLLPYLRRRRVRLVALLGNLRSTLGREADATIDASVDKEACPLNLAPTSSSTLAMALGDALAVAIFQAKGLTAEDFAFNHPSGRLGRRLSLRVGDLMHAGDDCPLTNPEATWLEVVKGISGGGMGATLVAGEDHALMGIVTDGDLRRAMERVGVGELETLTARAMMTAEPVAVGPDMLAYEALRVMEDRPSQISVLPVLDDERRCLGIIRVHDLVRAGL